MGSIEGNEEAAPAPSGPAGSGRQSAWSGVQVWFATLSALAAIIAVSVLTIILDHQIRQLGFGVVGTGAGAIALLVWLAASLKFGLRGMAALQLLSMLLILVVALLAVVYSDTVERFAGQSYLAVLLMSFAGAATVMLPAPAAVSVVTFSQALGDPIGVGLIAAVGQVGGELISYYLGFAGKRLLERGPGYERIRRMLERRGRLEGLVILGLAAFPNPLFDVVGLVAGAVRYPLRRFVLLAWAGNTFKYVVVFGGIGSQVVRLLQGG